MILLQTFITLKENRGLERVQVCVCTDINATVCY